MNVAVATPVATGRTVRPRLPWHHSWRPGRR